MATNGEIATSLRALAEAADDDIAQHDLNTLADALEPSAPFDVGSFEVVHDVDANEIIRELEGVDNRQDAIDAIEKRNTFPSGGVIDSSAASDVDSELYVFAPRTEPLEVDAPDGWYVSDELDGDGIGFDRK